MNSCLRSATDWCQAYTFDKAREASEEAIFLAGTLFYRERIGKGVWDTSKSDTPRSLGVPHSK
jgi:hypothetical protein